MDGAGCRVLAIFLGVGLWSVGVTRVALALRRNRLASLRPRPRYVGCFHSDASFQRSDHRRTSSFAEAVAGARRFVALARTNTDIDVLNFDVFAPDALIAYPNGDLSTCQVPCPDTDRPCGCSDDLCDTRRWAVYDVGAEPIVTSLADLESSGLHNLPYIHVPSSSKSSSSSQSGGTTSKKSSSSSSSASWGICSNQPFVFKCEEASERSLFHNTNPTHYDHLGYMRHFDHVGF